MEHERYLDLHDAATDNLYPALFQCFAIILCGYIAGRLNMVSQSESKGIATFVGTFALPSLIFLSLARLEFSMVNWTFLLAILLAKGLVFFSVIAVTLLVSKQLNLARAGIFAIFCTQSNDFALGYPIINAIYQTTHPEYALYLYLMAPISLAILNPVAFVLMEITKQNDVAQAITNEEEREKNLSKLKLLRQIFKGVFYNPVLAMTILGIIGNFLFRHNFTIYIEGLLEVFGNSFSATALFLLGLRMVGQIHRLRGPALLLPCVLIMVKLIILPVVMREFVSSLRAGSNETETTSLSTYAFLYGTIPTAPAVFVFSNLYQLEIDLVASSMVICTFLSAPMMYMSAQVISINKDYQVQLKRFGFNLSIVALVAAVWVLIVFIVTKKYKRMPHRLTLCLLVSQLMLAISVIWGGPLTTYVPSWHLMLQQCVRAFSMYSCLLWTSMLSVGILMLESRGPCFVASLWPALALAAWGGAAAAVGALLAARPAPAPGPALSAAAVDAVRLCMLVFCLTVTTGCLIVYIRFRRRGAAGGGVGGAAGGGAGGEAAEETTSLVDHAEPVSNTQSISHSGLEDQGCYGAITATPSPSKNANGCCLDDPNCIGAINSDSHDIEEIGDNLRECACPSPLKQRCAERQAGPHLSQQACLHLSGQACPHLSEQDLLLPEPARGRGGQLLRHTVLIIVYSLTMFIGIAYTAWKMMKKDESGIFVEIEFFDIAANYGQALLMLVLFGLDPEEILIPAVRYFKKKWHGADTIQLPPVDELSFETKHVCDQFITHHLDRCKEAIAKDTRWRMRTYRGVFRGSCLVRWLRGCGLARDARDAVTYGRHLLDGRLIRHVGRHHHFSDSPLLYTFN